MINCTVLGKAPKQNMKAATFPSIVLCAHIIVAAEQVIQAEDLPFDFDMVSGATFDEYVKVLAPSDVILDNGVQDSVCIHALQSIYQWHCCGMAFATQLKLVIGIGL